MKKNKAVIYPALITPDEGNTFDVEFVDVPDALSFGNSTDEAVLRGKDALRLALTDYSALPTPTPVEKIQKNSDQIIVLVAVELYATKPDIKEPMVRKNVTVPENLAVLAKNKNLNFSAILTIALWQELNL